MIYAIPILIFKLKLSKVSNVDFILEFQTLLTMTMTR